MPLESARNKLKWANKHVGYFESGLSDFFRSHPYEFFDEPNPQAGNKRRVRLSRPIPFELQCIVGDAIHNFRSALDHIAYNAALRKTSIKGYWLRKVYFTASPGIEAFGEAIAKREVYQIGRRWLSYLRSIEPYHGGNGCDLWALSFLDNLDKHRDLIEVSPYANLVRFEEGGAYGLVGSGSLLKEGIEVPPEPLGIDSNTYTHFAPTITFANVEAEGVCPAEPATNTLSRFNNAVSFAIGEAARIIFS